MFAKGKECDKTASCYQTVSLSPRNPIAGFSSLVSSDGAKNVSITTEMKSGGCYSLTEYDKKLLEGLQIQLQPNIYIDSIKRHQSLFSLCLTLNQTKHFFCFRVSWCY
ncbi:hypothetical protein GOODEAATRI_022095 [Goodea atripinnis]|uniref:Uncharacterized protein n=1 Tax=Goodea atripinnis TaxID=208336 RepID=A0ABV0PG20_9TELE